MVSETADDAYALKKIEPNKDVASDSIQRAITRDPKTAKPKNFSECDTLSIWQSEYQSINVKL